MHDLESGPQAAWAGHSRRALGPVFWLLFGVGLIGMLLCAAALTASEAADKDTAMTSKPLERMNRFKMKEFLIGSWCFHGSYDEAYCRAYREAGFNTMVDAPTVLDDARKTGLKVIISTIVHPVFDKSGKIVPGKFTLGPYARLADLKWFQEEYGKHPALIGYLLNDNCQLHDYTIECAKWMAQNAPGLYPYMSHNPDPAGQAKVVEWMPILSSQNYPYGYHNEWPEAQKRREFCDRLEADRAHANENDMVLWPIFAALGKPNLGASQIRFQAFSSIGYGAQALFYFAYSSNRPVWKKTGTAFQATKYCNDYIARVVGPRVLGHRCIGVYHTPLDGDVPKGALTPGQGKLIEQMDDALLAGVLVRESEFKAKKQTPVYIVVVDKRTASEGEKDPEARAAHLTFGSSVRGVEILGAGEHRSGKVDGRAVSLNLKGGDGVLLKITPANPDGK